MKNKNIVTAVLALTVLLGVGLGCERTSSLTINGNELEYKNVTTPEAWQLLNYLIKVKYFDGQKKSAQLNKSGSTYQFRMVVKTEWQNDPSIHEKAKFIAEDLSINVFNNAPTEVHICDEQFKTIHVVRP